MILNAGNVADYLLDQGWITVESLVDGDYSAEEIVSKRNRSFKIRRGSHSGYFVKQVLNWTPKMFAAMEREAACYHLVAEPAFSVLAPLLPRFHGYDAKRHILLLEMVRDAENLAVFHRRHEEFPTEVASKLGRLLGNVHGGSGDRYAAFVPLRVDDRDIRDRKSPFPKEPPWILSVAETTEVSLERSLETGLSRVLGVVQRHSEFRETLAALKAEWRADSLIHGDLRWLNILVQTPGAGAEKENSLLDRDDALDVKLIDWELADVGDPCWDVGSVLESYISAWVFSLPTDVPASPESRELEASRPLEMLLPAVAAFWHSYVECLGLQTQQRLEILEKSVRYAGARLIQTAIESVPQTPTVSPSGRSLLQVAFNVLTDPRTAVIDLLELDG